MNSYPSPQYRQEDQDQNGILRALGGIALTAGAGVGLLYGLGPKRRQSLRQGIANFVNDEKVAENLKKARAASPETKTAAFRSETPRGNQVVDLNPTGTPVRFDNTNRPDISLEDAAFGNTDRPATSLADAVFSAKYAPARYAPGDAYAPAYSSEFPSWQSAGNMVGDYGQLYGARRSKETTQAIEQARRQAAADTYVNTIRSNPDSYQLSIPGVNPELIALRFKGGLPSPGELTSIAESRPLSAAPEQGSFALTYNQARGAVAPQADSDGFAETAARIARNRAKDKARVSDYMSDVLESVISETEFTSETIPSDLLKLAERAGTGNIDAQDVNTFKNWAESAFKNDPVVLSEIDQNLSSITFSPKTSTNPVVSQAVEAIDTGADQAAQRVSRTVQRDPGESLTEFSLAKDAYEQRGASPVQAADAAVAATEGNVAFTQTDRPLTESLDPWVGSATVPTPQRSAASSAETKLLPSVALSPREKSQQFLQQRFEELGATISSPTRRERILSADPALAEAYELYASTGDPAVLSRLSKTPSSPVNVTLREQSEFVSPEVSTKSLYKPGVYPEYVGDLIEKDIELTNQISSLSQEKLNIAARQKELGEQELMLKNAMAQEPPGRDSYSRMLGKVKYEQQNLPAPESLNVDIGDAMAERDFTRVQLESAENLGPRYKLIPREEGTRAFYEQTPEGQIIPETLEVRGGRPSVELEPKRGGGRGAAEYDPSGQTGSRRGTYGLESTRYPQATSAQRPTQYTADELVQEALEQATASLEGDVPIPPPRQQVSRQFGPRASKQSLVASEIVRRAMIEGRDVKEALRKGGFGI